MLSLAACVVNRDTRQCEVWCRPMQEHHKVRAGELFLQYRLHFQCVARRGEPHMLLSAQAQSRRSDVQILMICYIADNDSSKSSPLSVSDRLLNMIQAHSTETWYETWYEGTWSENRIMLILVDETQMRREMQERP